MTNPRTTKKPRTPSYKSQIFRVEFKPNPNKSLIISFHRARSHAEAIRKAKKGFLKDIFKTLGITVSARTAL